VFGLALAALAFARTAAADGPPSSRDSEPKARREERIKQAKALNDEANRLYLRGQYRPAIAKLEAAVALDPTGKDLVYNLALSYEHLGELDVAESYYWRYMEMETDPKLRERTRNTLTRIDGAKKELAGKSPSSSPYASSSSSSSSSLPTESKQDVGAPRGRNPWVIPAAGVAATGIFTGVVLGISAIARNPGPGAKTGPGVSIDDLRADAALAHRQAVLADISLLVGAAAAGVAIYLYYYAPPPPSSSSAPSPQAGRRVELDIAAGRAAVRVLF
jgi:tetratricopeptide (TPR) repeat protein